MNGPSDPSAHSIPDIRRQIDDIDNTLLDLINQRLNLARQIGELKKTSGNPVMDATRENEILSRLTGRNTGPLNAEALRHIFGHFIAISREIQAPLPPQKNHLEGEGETWPQDMTGLENRLTVPLPDVFFPSISAATALYGVMGDPVGHSLSPVMHNAAFRKAGMDAVYTAFHVKDLKAAVAGIRALNIRGVSVTLPHKIAIMDLLDDVDPAAHSIGAVNTVVHRSGRLLGFNTDSPGAMAALMAQTPVAGKQVAVLGSGGAARAVAHGVSACGGNLVVVSRNETAGRQLAQDMNGRFGLLADFTAEGIDILINATSVGMAPDSDATPVPAQCLRPEMTVMDIVYTPLETRLLKDARAAGCRVVDGLSMLIHQGALQFEHWTGEKAPVAEMEAAARQTMARNTLVSLSPQAVFLGGEGRGEGGSKSDAIRIELTQDKKDLKKFQKHTSKKLRKKTKGGVWRFVVFEVIGGFIALTGFTIMGVYGASVHWPTAFVFSLLWIYGGFYVFGNLKRIEKDFGGSGLGESHLYSFTKDGISLQVKDYYAWCSWNEIQEVERVKGMILLFIYPAVAYVFPEHKLEDPDGFYQSIMTLYENAKKPGTPPQKNLTQDPCHD
ncbi:shikimate dehydrogenase [Desulfosarcina sp. OttesenSCG-928-G10]|nr:shikimate dehydrogenase [Desulfosarcina sp. OttesenSCG-928-G10]